MAVKIINKHVVISPAASKALDGLSDVMKMSRKDACELAIATLLEQKNSKFRDKKYDRIIELLERLIAIFEGEES